MKFSLTIILLFFLTNTVSVCVAQEKGTFRFKSGSFSGIDYMIITKKSGWKKKYSIIIDCNHYISNLGKTLYIRKEVFDDSGKYLATYPLIKDSSMLFNLSLSSNNSILRFLKLSNEEHNVIRDAFIKYSALSKKYALNADSLNYYLGWVEMQRINSKQ